ncbi:MAG: succinate dehydrogenase, hydrophobic membrane anchor protein [Pseudomonadota bacterium]
MSTTNFQTPAKAARGLGSAKEGTGHYIKQRVSAIALIFLVPWFLFSVIGAARSGYTGALEWVAQPLTAILLILTFGAAFYHMRLGMQVVIEDYLWKRSARQGFLILNTFVAIALFAATALSVLKISIAAAV